MPASVVRVWEDPGPETAPGLEWLLRCDQPLTDSAQALACARQYVSRWLTEDFHKALKTGLEAEKLKLQMAARLFAAVALLSVVALALVDLREKSRLQPDLPAEAAGLTATELRVLRHQSWRPVDAVWGPYTWPQPRWAGTWAAKGIVHPAGKPAGSAVGAGACSWKAFTWRRNCRTNNTQIF